MGAFKKALSAFLVLLLAINQLAFAQAVFADEISTSSATVTSDPTPAPSPTSSPTPTETPTPTVLNDSTQSATLSSPTPVPQPAPVQSDWQTSGDTATTINSVEVGKVYTAPQDGKVTVTFDKITTPGKLTIKKISTQNLSSINPVSDTAYDISSDMQNGTFDYTLTLPTPKTQNVEVKASEDGKTFTTLGNVTAQTDTLTITGLNHFTVFVVVGTISGNEATVIHEASDAVVINEFMFNPSTGNDWIELYNKGATSRDLTGWTIVDSTSIMATLDQTIPAGGFLAVDVSNRLNAASTGDTITLKDNSGTPVIISQVAYKDGTITGTGAQDVGTVNAGQSVARTTDGGSDWVVDTTPTKGWGDTLSAPTTVYVNSGYVGLSTGSQNQPFATIQSAINTVASGGTVNISAGSYSGNLMVDKAVTLRAATGANLTGQITIASDGVTVDGFNITNPNAGYGIIATDHSSLTITNNTIHDIGTTLAAGSAQAIAVISSSADVSNVNIENNHISNIGNLGMLHAGNAGSSAKGVYLGNSSGLNTFLNITVSGNTINNVYASTAPWHGGPTYGGGAGAYGLLVNHKTTGLTATNNTIGTLEGLWAHAIGLEGNTPSAVLTGNTITGLIDHKSPSDAVGIQIEDNASGATITGSGNTFNSTPIVLGKDSIRVDTSVPSFTSTRGPEVLLGGSYYYAGLNAFSKIQDGVNAVSSGGVVSISPGTYTENITLNQPISLSGPNAGVNPNTGTRSSEAVITGQVTVYSSGVTVNGLTITNPSWNGVTIKGIHVYNAGTGISNITLENNIFTNINNAAAHGSYGVMVQGVTSGVSLLNNKFDHISSAGWAHAIEVTPTSNSATVPQNTVITGNSISNVTNPLQSDAYAFSVDSATYNSSPIYADASQITFNHNSLFGNVRNLDTGHVLNVTSNYWGNINPASSIISGPVSFDPWYSDSAMTTLKSQTTPSGGTNTATLVSPITTTTTTSAGAVSIDIPSSTIITGPSGWDGTITLPTVTSAFTLTPDSGNTASAVLAIEVGSVNTPLTLGKAVKLTFAGQAGNLIGWSQAGVFHQITTPCGDNTQATNDHLAPGADCKISVGSDLFVWTKHFTTFISYVQSVIPPAPPGNTVSDGLGCGSHDCNTARSQVPQAQVLGATTRLAQLAFGPEVGQEVLGTTTTSEKVQKGEVKAASVTPSPTQMVQTENRAPVNNGLAEAIKNFFGAIFSFVLRLFGR